MGLRHATNYLNILLKSERLWPTTEEIERSYRDAVVLEGLAPQTAFDGVCANGVLQSVFGVHWAITLGMEPGRIEDSHVFDDLKDNIEANQILAVDFMETLIVQGKYTLLPDILAQSGMD